MLNLDTHMFIGGIRGDLTPRELELMTSNPWSVSAMVIWEIAKLSAKGRIDFSLDHPGVVAALERSVVWPITPEIAKTSVALDFSSNPADEIIAATSVVHRVPLLTRDAKILAPRRVPFAF